MKRMTTKAPVEDALGLRLKEARLYRGLSQDDIAGHIGVSRSALSRMEGGTRNVSAAELSRLAKLYKTTIDSLAGRGSNGADSIGKLARATAALSDKDREEVRRFAEYLRDRSTSEQA